ncbi:MMPL family transporter [Streptomyces sp. NPDC053493]|uniref:MMPL family transporter n=1 Tax=Streptomyces sp. NPDC053493 TaxID=3365705 RepID=UPI0037CCD6E7
MAYRSRRWCWTILLGALTTVLVAALQTGPAYTALDVGGSLAVGTEAQRAEQRAREQGIPSSDLILAVSGPPGAAPAPALLRAGDRAVTTLLDSDPAVRGVRSFHSTGDPWLRSRDGRTMLVSVDLLGDENHRVHAAEHLVPRIRSAAPGLRVEAMGAAWVAAEIEHRSQSDLLRAEVLAAPVILLVLLIAYGSLVCALVPLLIAGAAVTCTVPVLALLSRATDVSVFAVNAASAIGFGLAVDYTLFLLARYQEEIARGAPRHEAIRIALRTSGRSVVFSSVAVATCLGTTLCVPLPLLRGLALAGITVSLISAVSALVLLPCLVTLLRHHLHRLDPFCRLRRSSLGLDSRFWRTIARHVTRRPLLAGTAAASLLLIMALPFSQVRLGLIDHQSLPSTAMAAATTTRVQDGFDQPPDRLLTVMAELPPGRTGPSHVWAEYRARLTSLPHVSAVRILPFQAAARPNETFWVVASDTEPTSPQAVELVRALRDTPGSRLVGGRAAHITDTVSAVRSALPHVAWLLPAAFAVLLAAFTCSVIAPLKAILVAAISLGATLGAVVVIFQYGHGSTLLGGFTVTGTLDTSLLLFTLAIALALSVDYEVFLLGRIKEEFEKTGDNTLAVVEGIARTGRLMTSAAVAVAVSMTGLATSQVTELKLVGIGVATAALVDSVLVRGVLVPAVMAGLGPANWWHPVRARRSQPAQMAARVRPSLEEP